jgi:hypothetical protein
MKYKNLKYNYDNSGGSPTTNNITKTYPEQQTDPKQAAFQKRMQEGLMPTKLADVSHLPTYEERIKEFDKRSKAWADKRGQLLEAEIYKKFSEMEDNTQEIYALVIKSKEKYSEEYQETEYEIYSFYPSKIAASEAINKATRDYKSYNYESYNYDIKYELYKVINGPEVLHSLSKDATELYAIVNDSAKTMRFYKNKSDVKSIIDSKIVDEHGFKIYYQASIFLWGGLNILPHIERVDESGLLSRLRK